MILGEISWTATYDGVGVNPCNATAGPTAPVFFADGDGAGAGETGLVRLEQNLPILPLRDFKARCEKEYIERVLQRLARQFVAGALRFLGDAEFDVGLQPVGGVQDLRQLRRGDVLHGDEVAAAQSDGGVGAGRVHGVAQPVRSCSLEHAQFNDQVATVGQPL